MVKQPDESSRKVDKSTDQAVKSDSVATTPAMLALMAYRKAEVGTQKLGSLTKDELLARIGIVHVGLALDVRCPTLSPSQHASALQTVARAEEVMQSNGIDAALIERIHGSSRVFAANQTCDERTKALIDEVLPAVQQTCTALAQDDCSQAVTGASQ